MRFEYRPIASISLEATPVFVRVWLTHSTGDTMLGILVFDERPAYDLWKVSMQFGPMHVLVEG